MGGVRIVVFSDLVDSTALLARLGDDRMERIRRAHVDDVRSVVTVAGGRLVKTLGDGTMASFESALGALRAAAGIQASVERLDAGNGKLGIVARVGVGVGEPIADGADLHGMPVVIASRLCAAAASGEVLVQELVGALVASRDGVVLEPARPYELKGVPAPVRAGALRWRELPSAGEAPDAPAVPDEQAATAEQTRIPLPRMLTAYTGEPLIGRDREIAALRTATATTTGRRAVLVLGEPGIGKTRHAAEAAADAHARGAVVALARCPPEPTIAFEPWVRAIGELALAGDERWRTQLGTAAGAELSALVPELSTSSPAPGSAGAGELATAEGARYRLLRGISAALAHAAGDAPLVLGRFAARGVESLRRADIHVPVGLCSIAIAATALGDREAGERVRPLLEPLRPLLIQAYPMMLTGYVVEWPIGRIELLLGRADAAVRELRVAVERADALDLVWMLGNARADLALALHARGRPGDLQQAHAVVTEGERVAERLGTRWATRELARSRAVLDGREPPPMPQVTEGPRPLRSLGTRSGRRALAALVRGQDDVALERRFADPRRQRALLRAMARAFQPAHAGGFVGVIAWELEPYAIESPPEAPWRWALEIDARAGRARLLEPAPLDAAATIHVGLADWVRITAGVQSPIGAMAVGRCSVSGEVLVAGRLEAMFGATEAL